MKSDHKLIIALDNMSPERCSDFIKNITKYQNDIIYKVNSLVTKIGLEGIKQIFNKNEKIMLDLKWHDIPNTLKNNLNEIKQAGLGEQITYATIHSSNGRNAIKELSDYKKEIAISTKILCITILTSKDNNDTQHIYGAGTNDMVSKLSEEGYIGNTDGFVCAAQEAQNIRNKYPDLEIITPGIRFQGDNLGDQKRITSPQEAIKCGVNHIVMGRPITESQNPQEKIEKFFNEIKRK